MSQVFEYPRILRFLSWTTAGKDPGVSPSTPSRNVSGTRQRRVFLAFSCALFLVSGTFFVAGTNIPGVIAEDGSDAAAFFRADRARIRAQRTYNNVRTLSIYREQRTGFASRDSAGRRAERKAHQKAKRHANKQKHLRFASIKDSKLVEKIQKTDGFQPITDATQYDQGTRTVCVRLCDGYSFPVGALDGRRDIGAHEAICSGLCPGAPTELYVLGSGATDISEALSARRNRAYAALPVALRFSSKREKTCSCRAPNQSHLSLVSLRRDFTLRKGDAIMTAKGIRVFKGARRWPYNNKDFATLRRSSRMFNRSDRAMLNKLERASSQSFMARQAASRLRARTYIEGEGPAAAARAPLPPARPQKLAAAN
jgi:hypothetical protein